MTFTKSINCNTLGAIFSLNNRNKSCGCFSDATNSQSAQTDSYKQHHRKINKEWWIWKEKDNCVTFIQVNNMNIDQTSPCWLIKKCEAHFILSKYTSNQCLFLLLWKLPLFISDYSTVYNHFFSSIHYIWPI